MKFIDEYRQGDIAARLAAEVARLTERPLKLMEVCGGHTHTIFKYGIEDLLPENITMIHGPGCPVCVIPLGRVDDAISIAQQPGVIFTTFGDAMRVPGSKTSLLDAKASGADVRMVYSPLDALKLARRTGAALVFLALGFETTAPSTAMTVLQADKDAWRTSRSSATHHDCAGFEGAPGFARPATRRLLAPARRTSSARGLRVRPPRVRQAGRRRGLRALEILQSVTCSSGRSWGARGSREPVRGAASPRRHRRASKGFRCLRAARLLRVAGPRLHRAQRHEAQPQVRRFDAELKFNVPGLRVADPKACQCGEILKGVKRPWECKVFGTACTPETPIGSCMVSSEGACAAYYNFGRLSKIAERSAPSGGRKSAVDAGVTV